MKNIFFLLIILSSTILNSSDYNISLPEAYKISGTFRGSTHDESSIKEEDGFFRGHGINENGAIFGQVKIESGPSIYFSDPIEGVFFINGAPNKYTTYYRKSMLNGKNQLVGHISSGDLNNIFIWDRLEGRKTIEVFDHSFAIAKDFNDAGQIIGESQKKRSYPKKTRPFLWENGISTDMGPGSKFAAQIEEQGYVPIDISLEAINNNGEIAGFFTYGKYNKIKDEYVAIGKKAFFWNGTFHIIPLIEGLMGIDLPLEHYYFPRILLNNKGTVLISAISNDFTEFQTGYGTFLWHQESGLQILDDFESYSINDRNEILGIKANPYDGEWELQGWELFAIWKNGSYTTISELLGGRDLSNLAPGFSDTFEVEKIKDIYDINNNGQIVALGLVWGEWVPCIIEPNTADLPIE